MDNTFSFLVVAVFLKTVSGSLFNNKDSAQVERYSRIVDAGEAEAIELARELHADQLLFDDRNGRKLAVQEGAPVIGLLGVVLLARRKRLFHPHERCCCG